MKHITKKYPGLFNYKTVFSFGWALVLALACLSMFGLATLCLNRAIYHQHKMLRIPEGFSMFVLMLVLAGIGALVLAHMRVVRSFELARMPRQKLTARAVGNLWGISGVLIGAAGALMFHYAFGVWDNAYADKGPGLNTHDLVIAIAGLAAMLTGILCILPCQRKHQQHHREVCVPISNGWHCKC